MTILDRYIARQYLLNAAILLVILAGFVVTIDVSLNLNRYWENALRLSKEGDHAGGGLRALLLTVHLIADLWWPRLLQLFSYMSGVVTVGAMGFTVAQLVRHRELVAVLMSGQSLARVARPIIAGAILIQALSLLNQEYIIANDKVAKLLTRDAGDAGKRDLGTVRVGLQRDPAGRVYYASAFDADKGELQNLTVWDRDEARQVTARTTAASATWNQGGWDLTQGLRDPITVGAAPTPVTRLETELDPTLLRVNQYRGYGQKLGSGQIAGMVQRLDALAARVPAQREQVRQTRDSLDRIRWGRWSLIASNLLSLLIAMSFFLSREPTSLLRQCLKSAPISIASLVGGVLGASASIEGLPPWLSALIPVGVLGPIALALFTALPRRS